MLALDGARAEPTIAVDVMGGDYAPDEVLKGALDARARGINVVLVGPRDLIESRLDARRSTVPIVHAPDVIRMDEAVTSGLRHRESSLQAAARLVHDHEADAVVSCGNSAAIYFVTVHMWGTQPGIDRPAFGGTLATRGGPVFMIDIGANTAVKSGNLVQFGVMGDVFMRVCTGMPAPRVALLSNGTEESKGTKQVKEAHEALSRLDLNFVGNVEANQLFGGVVDVLVCDGFAGNVLLKGGEGVANEIFDLLKQELSKDPLSKVAAAALRPAFARVKRRLDYEEYGGAPVLGVNGIMINCHGRSKAKAVTNGILLAHRMATQGLVNKIGDALHHEDVEAGRRRRLARALHLRHVDS